MLKKELEGVLALQRSELKAVRAKQGMTQKDIAKMLNISNSSYCRKENQKIDFTQSEIKVIAVELKLTSEEVTNIFFS